MVINLNHGLMASRPHFSGDALDSIAAQEAAEAAARAGTSESLIASSGASSGAGAAAAAKFAYEKALADGKTIAEAGRLAKAIADQKLVEQQAYMTSRRAEVIAAAQSQNAEASEYYNAVRAGVYVAPASKSNMVGYALAAITAYLVFKG